MGTCISRGFDGADRWHCLLRLGLIVFDVLRSGRENLVGRTCCAGLD